MTYALSSWLGITLMLGAMALIAVWARRQTLWRGAALFLFLVMAPAAALAVGVVLGWAVPTTPTITIAGGQHLIIGVKMEVGRGIFLMVDNPDGEPRLHRLPWDPETASEIQKLRDGRDPDSNPDGNFLMVLPFDPSLNTKPEFQPLPQPRALPQKPPQEEPERYEQDA